MTLIGDGRVQGKEEPRLRLALHRRAGNKAGTRGSLKHFQDWGSRWGSVCGNRGSGERKMQHTGGSRAGVWKEQALDVGGRAGRLSAIQHGAKPWLLGIWGESTILTAGP